LTPESFPPSIGPLNIAKKLFLFTFDYVIYYYYMVEELTFI
jgi:hypothetical protein